MAWNEEKTPNATLVAHCGGEIVNRDFLRTLDDPAPQGKNHLPVRFDNLLDKLEMGCNFFGRQWDPDTLKVALANDNQRLFGVVQLKGEEVIPGEVGMALGFRASTDMSVTLRTDAGGNVFVCDNLALSGQETIFSKKSTKNLNLTASIVGGLESFFEKDLAIKGLIENARSTKIGEKDVKALLWDSMVDKLVPQKYLKPASAFYFDGEFNDVKAPECDQYRGTLWGLHNAFTRVLKSEPLVKRYPATQKLGKLLTYTV